MWNNFEITFFQKKKKTIRENKKKLCFQAMSKTHYNLLVPKLENKVSFEKQHIFVNDYNFTLFVKFEKKL